MISLLCYWWILLWNVENVNKEMFAAFSTFEIAGELLFIIPFVAGGIYGLIVERKNK